MANFTTTFGVLYGHLLSKTELSKKKKELEAIFEAKIYFVFALFTDLLSLQSVFFISEAGVLTK